jgi:FKBP-type peptidyl-prolyl cis-trans isomerase
LPYKIKKGSSTVLLKNGQFLKFNIEFKLGNKDSTLNSSYGHIPAYMRLDTAHLGKYNFTEILPKCSVGDVITFTLSIDTLKNLGMIPEFNRTFNKGGVIKGKVEILAAFDNQALVEADYKKETEAEKAKEDKELEAYIAKNNLKVQKTPSGAYVVIDNAGDLTNKADSGKEVTVLYKGYTENGKVFDSNMDKPGAAPLKVVVGAHKVIPGWDEGLKFFAKGAKGKILIPAMLGYGQQGQGPIKPFSNLIFDVEITDVNVAPPPTVAKAVPSMMNPRMMMHGKK